MNLCYLKDSGLFKRGDKFFYNKTKKEAKGLVDHLSKIRVPPAWTNVWYASNKKSHIQVHGTDISGKKQYILSEEWINNSKYEKYDRMKRFIRHLSRFKKKIILPKRVNVLTKEILINLLFNLLIDTHIRVGNEIYAEQNNTYGLTTLNQKHLKYDSCYILNFVGKSKIKHSVKLPEKYNIFMEKLILPNKNKPLFHYNGQTINSEELNNYLKEHMGKEYTCKDFRTYSANILFIKSFLKNCKHGKPKHVILKSIDESAQLLGHTRNISKKSYISNNLLDYCTNSFEEASSSSSSSLLTKTWS